MADAGPTDAGIMFVKCHNGDHYALRVDISGEVGSLVATIPFARSSQVGGASQIPLSTMDGEHACPNCGNTALALCGLCNKLSCCAPFANEISCEWGCGSSPAEELENGASAPAAIWEDL